MQAVLVQEKAEEVPPNLLAMKYYRIKLASGKFAGSKPVGSDCDKHRRCTNLLRIASTERMRRQDGSVEERDVSTFGAALHYAAVFVDGKPMAFAYVERVGLPRTAQVGLVTLRVSSGSSASWGLDSLSVTCLSGLLSKWLARLRERARILYCIVANRFLRESRALGQMPGYFALMRLRCYEKTILQPARASKTSTLLAKYI